MNNSNNNGSGGNSNETHHKSEMNNKVHPDLSAQIVYCQAKRFDSKSKFTQRIHSVSVFFRVSMKFVFKAFKTNKFYEIYSLSDNKRLLSPELAKEFLNIHFIVLSRIYPSFLRVNSLNFDPQPYWLIGFQLVALNYQSRG